MVRRSQAQSGASGSRFEMMGRVWTDFFGRMRSLVCLWLGRLHALARADDWSRRVKELLQSVSQGTPQPPLSVIKTKKSVGFFPRIVLTGKNFHLVSRSTLQFAQREKSSRNTQFHIFLFVRGVRPALEARPKPIHTSGWITLTKPPH